MSRPSPSACRLDLCHLRASFVFQSALVRLFLWKITFPSENCWTQYDTIELVLRLVTDLTGVKDAGPQAHWGPSCKQPSDHNFLESNTKERTPSE